MDSPSTRTKNLFAALVLLIGLAAAYVVIQRVAHTVPMQEASGAVATGTIDPPARAVDPQTPAMGTEADAPLVPSPATDGVAQVSVPAVPEVMSISAAVATRQADAIDPEAELAANPPAAVGPVPTTAAEPAVAASADRLVLSAADTTVVARRYVDTPPAAEAAPTLRMSTRFASAVRIVPFAFNRVGMGPEGEAAVKELVPLAQRAERVHVRGRTDARGSVEINKQVALERAYTVRAKFVDAGVPEDKLGISYCTQCFIAGNETEAGRRANRRVDVEFIMPADEIDTLPEPQFARDLPESARELSFARSIGDEVDAPNR